MMTKTKLIILALLMGVMSCTEHDHNLQLIEQADALIYTQPDSSMKLLQQVERSTLSTASTRAYYALLHTQAAYRIGDFYLAEDSLAHAAVEYYSEHTQNKERWVRSLIYLGLHEEVHGQPETAMALYKQAEAIVEDNDYRNLAQINYRIGQLLSNNNVQNNEDLNHYHKALYYYNKVGDTLQIIYSLLATGALQRGMGIDSARHNLELAYKLSRQRNDTANCARSLEYLARGYLKDSIHETAKEFAIYCVRHYPNAKYTVDAMLDAACAYALMGYNDSAQYYMDLAAQNTLNQQQQSMQLFCQKTMAKNKHDVVSYINYNEKRELLHDSLRNLAVITKLLEMDQDSEATQKQIYQSQTKRINWLVAVVLALILALTSIGVYNHRRNHQQFSKLKEQIEQLKEEQSIQKQEFEQGRLSDVHLNQRLAELLSAYSGLCDKLINMSNDYPEKVFYKQFLKEVESFTERGELINELQKYIDDNNNQALCQFFSQHPQLDEKERGMVILTALGMRSSSIAVCLGLKNDAVMRSLRHRLTKRLQLEVPLTDYLESIVKNKPFLYNK